MKLISLNYLLKLPMSITKLKMFLFNVPKVICVNKTSFFLFESITKKDYIVNFNTFVCKF